VGLPEFLPRNESQQESDWCPLDSGAFASKYHAGMPEPELSRFDFSSQKLDTD
jgi:hypothetical protein